MQVVAALITGYIRPKRGAKELKEILRIPLFERGPAVVYKPQVCIAGRTNIPQRVTLYRQSLLALFISVKQI